MKKNNGLKSSVFFFAVLCLFSFAGAQPTQSQHPQAQPPQYQQQPAPVSLEKISANIYQVKGGSGANAAVYVGEKEILLIDAKMSEDSAKQMLDEVRKLSSDPIAFIALTHSDGDHVNGLPGFPAAAKIVAHEETRRYMIEAFKEERQKACLPQITFSERVRLYFGEHVVELLYFGPAHTSGDVVIYFPEEKVAALGDLLFVGRDPLVHRHKNGSSFGLVKVLRAVLGLDAQVFLSGHAEKGTRSDIEAEIKFVEEEQAKIRALVGQGKTLEEIKAIYKIEDRPVVHGRPRFMSLPEVIYLELTERK
jgi:glyoxylase-like metal-dependent hydrolase (beta-lactamase superfamily II)